MTELLSNPFVQFLIGVAILLVGFGLAWFLYFIGKAIYVKSGGE